jgi:hypothetical protein
MKEQTFQSEGLLVEVESGGDILDVEDGVSQNHLGLPVGWFGASHRM